MPPKKAPEKEDNAAVNPKNILVAIEEDVNDEQKAELYRTMEEFRLQCLQSFSVTKRGEATKKTEFPLPRQITIAESSGKLQDMIDEAVHHALINQAGVMTNTVHNAVVSSLRGEAAQGFTGPAYVQPMGVFSQNASSQPFDLSYSGVNPQGSDGASASASQSMTQQQSTSQPVLQSPSGPRPMGQPQSASQPIGTDQSATLL